MSPEHVIQTCLACFAPFGSRSWRKLRRSFDCFEDVWRASSQTLMRAGLPESTVGAFIDWRRTTDPEDCLRQLERQAIRVVFPEDDDYPRGFLSMHDRPERLFVRGTLTRTPLLSIVGTRQATSYGTRCIEKLVPSFVQAGFGIVSGCALGIDGLVHAATLKAGGATVGIFAGGIDDAHLYPRAHHSLIRRMLEQGGACLSEFPPGTDARREFFPIRNRLIAGMSPATIVIEAHAKSGSLITARLALEENREVLAVPGPIGQSASDGCHQLLKLGARVCTGLGDVLEALQLDQIESMHEARASLPLDPEDHAVLDLLEEPRHIDLISRALEQSAAKVGSRLCLLELKGLVKSIGGQTWLKA